MNGSPLNNIFEIAKGLAALTISCENIQLLNLSPSPHPASSTSSILSWWKWRWTTTIYKLIPLPPPRKVRWYLWNKFNQILRSIFRETASERESIMACLLSQMPLPPASHGRRIPLLDLRSNTPPPPGYRSQLVSGGCHGVFQSGQVNISHLQGRVGKHLDLRVSATETTFHRILSMLDDRNNIL